MVLYVGGALISFCRDPARDSRRMVACRRGRRACRQVPGLRLSLRSTPRSSRATTPFWAGLIGGCFLTTASHGTEQLMVQRLLAARNERESRAALFASWFVDLLSVRAFPVHRHASIRPLSRPSPGRARSRADRIYPDFVWNNLPPGIAGLVIAAILAAGMSNLSAALNALASTSVMDFYKPLFSRLPPATTLTFSASLAGPPSPGAPSCFLSDSSRATGVRYSKPASPSPLSSTAACSASFYSDC